MRLPAAHQQRVPTGRWELFFARSCQDPNGMPFSLGSAGEDHKGKIHLECHYDHFPTGAARGIKAPIR